MQLNIPVILAALSICSPVLSHPVETRDTGLVVTIHSAVWEFQSSVSSNLTDIVSTVSKDVSSSIVPTVKDSLVGIVSSVDTAVGVIVPVVVGSVAELATGEVEAVIADLGTLRAVVSDLLHTVEYTLVSVLGDTFALVKPEVEQVLSAVLPLLEPVIEFAENLVVDVASADGVVGELKTLSSQIGGILNGTVSVVANTVN